MGLPLYTRRPLFQCLHVGGIQLQRQADHALQGLDHLLHQGRLIHAGGTHVHVQHLRPGFRLADGLFQNVVHITLPQCLLEALFAGGVDALAHHGDAVHVDIIHRGCTAPRAWRGPGGPARSPRTPRSAAG